MVFNLDMSLKITHLRLQVHLPEVNELTEIPVGQANKLQIPLRDIDLRV